MTTLVVSWHFNVDIFYVNDNSVILRRCLSCCLHGMSTVFYGLYDECQTLLRCDKEIC